VNFRLILMLAIAGELVQAQSAHKEWNAPFPPHRVIGNIYYVGSSFLASFLITTPEGHILVNSGTEETVSLIRASVEKLGFRFSDIKILLESQAHVDHVAGHALVRKLTGARVLAMAGDDGLIASGGLGDFQYENQWRWTPCPVDRVLHDGETVTLGGAVLTARLTPGHTKGCTTWTMTAEDQGRPYHVVIVGSARANPGYRLVDNAKYPEIAEDFKRTFRVLGSLQCDVFLGAHGWYYNMEEKFAHLTERGKNPFVDPKGFHDFLARSEEAFLKELEAQQVNSRTAGK
jgi:metallo-beta-lactamase class B